MNRISRTMLVLATAGLLGSGFAFAGNGPGDGSCDGDGNCDGSGKTDRPANHRRGGPAERMAGIANRLGLTLEQQIQVLEMFDLHAAERDQMRTRIIEGFGDEICAQRDQHRAEFREILTEEQLALHDEMMQNRNARGGRGGGQGPGMGGLECPGDG